MRRVYGVKVCAQYTGRSVCLSISVKDYHRREAYEKSRQKSADGIVVTSALGTKAGTCKNEEILKSH